MFLGGLGELRLAGRTLGFTFAKVTGFSLLTGLGGADMIAGLRSQERQASAAQEATHGDTPVAGGDRPHLPPMAER